MRIAVWEASGRNVKKFGGLVGWNYGVDDPPKWKPYEFIGNHPEKYYSKPYSDRYYYTEKYIGKGDFPVYGKIGLPIKSLFGVDYTKIFSCFQDCGL